MRMFPHVNNRTYVATGGKPLDSGVAVKLSLCLVGLVTIFAVVTRAVLLPWLGKS
jgi:hypothetical protein